jgi:hypothetical protein
MMKLKLGNSGLEPCTCRGSLRPSTSAVKSILTMRGYILLLTRFLSG